MVKHIQNKQTGKMAGSIGDGKNKIPTPATVLPTPQTDRPKPARTPIIVPESKISLNLHRMKDLGISYEYDYYEPSPNASVERDGENGAEYQYFTGLRVEKPVHGDEVLRNIFSLPYSKPIPNDIQELIETAKLNEVDTYEIKAFSSYYGEEARSSFNEETEKYLKEWYYNHNNATDSDGVLKYVRNRGTETTGLDPVEAIKKQVKETRGAQIAHTIKSAKYVTPKTIAISKIDIPPVTTLRDGTPIRTGKGNNIKKYMGVLIKQGTRYELVDGFAQLAQPHYTSTRAHFLILSETPENV